MYFESTYASIAKCLLLSLVRNKLPTPDTTAEYTHADFDKWLSEFGQINGIGAVDKLTTKVTLSAEVQGSDIKWNDMAGKLTMLAMEDKKEVCKLFDCELAHFTGNCGVKAISHLYFQPGAPVNTYKAMLKAIESFVWHKTNGGMLIGSDTEHGRTRAAIKAYGENYKHTDLTWNPNYTWSKDHKVACYWKDLNGETYYDYWNANK